MSASVIQFTDRNTSAIASIQTHEWAALHAQQAAENALSMALHYLRSNAHNVPGATSKAAQALVALRDLSDLLANTPASMHATMQPA